MHAVVVDPSELRVPTDYGTSNTGTLESWRTCSATLPNQLNRPTELLFVSAIALRPLLVFLYSIATPVGSSSKRRMQLLQSLSPMKLCTARTSRS